MRFMGVVGMFGFDTGPQARAMAPANIEPRGCPTPGACSADQMLAQMRKAIGAAMCAIGLAKALPNVAAEYDFEPVYHELTEAWRASEPPRPKSRS